MVSTLEAIIIIFFYFTCMREQVSEMEWERDSCHEKIYCNYTQRVKFANDVRAFSFHFTHSFPTDIIY